MEDDEYKKEIQIPPLRWRIINSNKTGIIKLLDKPNNLTLETPITEKELFSQSKKNPYLVDFIEEQFYEKTKVYKLIVARQNQIETIDGRYFYYEKKGFYYILYDNFSLIDSDFFEFLKEIDPSQTVLTIGDPINLWKEYLRPICNIEYINSIDLNLLRENYVEIGKITSLHNRREVGNFEIDIDNQFFQDTNSCKISEDFSQGFKSILFQTYTFLDHKIRWDFTSSGIIRIRSRITIEELSKLLEIIKLLFEKHVISFREDMNENE